MRATASLALQARRGTLAMTRRGLGAPAAGAALERALELALGLEPGPDVFAAVYRRYLWLLMAGDFAEVQRLATSYWRTPGPHRTRSRPIASPSWDVSLAAPCCGAWARRSPRSRV